MRHLCGRGPALGLAISQLARRPLRLAAAVSLAGLLVAVLAIPAGAWLRGSVPGAPASPRAQATVLMPVGAGSPESAHVREVLERADGLESLRFLPRDLALAELARRPALAGVNVAGLQPNPLPDAWVATFLPSATAELIEATVAQWTKDPWVGSVEYDPAPWRRWLAVAALARALAVPAAAALLLVGLAAFLACATLGPRPLPGESRLLLELGATPRSLRRPWP
jgi:cell division protein FtsX